MLNTVYCHFKQLGRFLRLVLVLPIVIFSHLATAGTVDEKVVAADLVFEGVVVDVQTRFSERESENDPAIPYRFVTYQVNRVLKGNYQQAQLSLRFLGGESENGQVLLIPGQPLFDVGDHDLLMVKGNNRYPCPLVGCAQGRYRYLGGMVVNELGQRIYLDANGQIVMGEKIENEELTTNQLSENVSIETKEVNEIDPEEVTNISEDYPSAVTADPAGFAENVNEKIHQNLSEEQLANLPEFQSSDPDQPFTDETYGNKGSSASQPPDQGLPANDDMPEDERLERELEAAMLAELEQLNDSPERQEALKSLSKKMEKKYPDFYVQEEGLGVITSARAESSGSSSMAPDTQPAGETGTWGVAVVVLGLIMIALGWFWFRKRQQ